MTIRYTCPGCGSVLKIRDEKAGTNGKCPKCKVGFLIPNPEETDEEGIEVESTTEESVDMPIELTPEVSESDDFDPADVLGTTPTFARSASVSNGSSSLDRKPSVAELMKDFEAAKKKDKKSTPEIARPVTPSTSALIQTSGTAADALSRNYQQRRDAASTPVARAQDAKAAEQRALLMEFLKTRAVPAIAIVIVLGYAYISWMTHEPYEGPPLYTVTGQVFQNGKPAEGIHVDFSPTLTGIDDLRNHATGTTNSEGEFRLMYRSPHEGAPLGEYEVLLMGADGNPIIPADGAPRFTVTEDDENNFKINL